MGILYNPIHTLNTSRLFQTLAILQEHRKYIYINDLYLKIDMDIDHYHYHYCRINGCLLLAVDFIGCSLFPLSFEVCEFTQNKVLRNNFILNLT